MDSRDKDIRFLKRYAIGSTTLIVLMAITAFVRQPTEAEVHRDRCRAAQHCRA